jgi:capsular polysaccharide biosynthesis protein
VYQDTLHNYLTKESLLIYVNNVKKILKQFLDNNLSHSWYTKVNNYHNIISSPTILDDITTYPFTKSFEQYLSEKNIELINPLQVP